MPNLKFLPSIRDSETIICGDVKASNTRGTASVFDVRIP